MLSTVEHYLARPLGSSIVSPTLKVPSWKPVTALTLWKILVLSFCVNFLGCGKIVEVVEHEVEVLLVV